MEPTELAGALAFLIEAERLKQITRSAWTSDGSRDTVAGHSWRLALMAAVLYADDPEVDLARLLQICLVHDLGEAIRGDVPAPEQSADDGRTAAERADVARLTASLAPGVRVHVASLWEEYVEGSTREARIARGLDKCETILQHTQGQNPPDFDYAFNLTYGRTQTEAHALVSALREALDTRTARRLKP